MKRAAILAMLLAAARPALAQAPRPAAPPANSVAGGMGPVTPPAAATPAERLAHALAQIGLNRCAPAVRRAAGFLFEDGEANFVVQPLGPDAERWPTVITIEGAHKAMGTTRFATLTVFPGVTCSGLYEQTIYWAMPCPQLKATVFSGFAGQKPLLRNVQVSEANPGLQLYLIPAGAGCTSVKKELFR